MDIESEVDPETKILDFFVRLKPDQNNWSTLQNTLKLDCIWLRYCNQILKCYELNLDKLHTELIPLVEIKEKFFGKLIHNIGTMSSLKFLNTCKVQEGFLKFLDIIINWNHRIALSRLRCGNFNIRMRTGSWLNEQRNIRTCRFCSYNTIEDEQHIIAMCDYFADLREAFTKELTKIEGTLGNGTCLEPCDWNSTNIMNDKLVLPFFARFIFKVWSKINKFHKDTID